MELLAGKAIAALIPGVLAGLVTYVVFVLLAMGAGAFLAVRLMGAREVADDHPRRPATSRAELEGRDSSAG